MLKERGSQAYLGDVIKTSSPLYEDHAAGVTYRLGSKEERERKGKRTAIGCFSPKDVLFTMTEYVQYALFYFHEKDRLKAAEAQ